MEFLLAKNVSGERGKGYCLHSASFLQKHEPFKSALFLSVFLPTLLEQSFLYSVVFATPVIFLQLVSKRIIKWSGC